MGATKRYIRDQFRLNKLTLDHENASDFYLAWWQTGKSPVPVLCIRIFLFLTCIAILTASLVISKDMFDLKFWPIFMTHWGVLLITLASGCAVIVSFVATVEGYIVSDGLPWYVKLYWSVYDSAIVVAIFITIFYYILIHPMLPTDMADTEFNLVLDLFVHGVNSVVMFCLLMTTRHPIHLLQFIYPFLFTIVYMTFSIIYYYAGGTSFHGETAIYPMLDWSNPGPTTGVVFGVAVFLLILHIFVMGLSALRDLIARRFIPPVEITTVQFA